MKDRSAWRRQWASGLVFVILLASAAPIPAQEPVNVQATRKEFGEAYRKGDWDRAAKIGLELEKLVPNSSREQYNLACVMAMALGTRHPDLFAGVIPVAGGYIPEIDAPSKAEAGNPRFYFMVGLLDRAARQVRLAASDYRAAGYEVDLRMFPDTGHEFPRNTRAELLRALRFVLDE